MPFKPVWRVVLPFAILLLLSIYALSGIGTVSAQGTVPPPGPRVIGTFGKTRGGEASFASGSFYEQARLALSATYSDVLTSELDTITTASLDGLQALYLDVSFGNTEVISPLTTQEQLTLRSFVDAGGCAILMVDNDIHDFGSVASNSLVTAFGMKTGGKLLGRIMSTVPDASLSPVTSGLFRVVSEFSQNYPGAIIDPGPNGAVLGTNPLGASLVEIPAGALTEDSGPVIVLTDSNTFIDTENLGYFPENVDLFLNVITYCLDPSVGPTYRLYAPSVARGS